MIRVLLNISDNIIREKISKRLGELTGGLEIIERGSFRDMDGPDVTVGEGDEILPVSALLEHLITSYTSMTGESFLTKNRGLKRVFIFRTYTGGSGLTAVSFVFARIICGNHGVRVLYADAGKEEPLIYGEFLSSPEGNLSELRYLSDKGRAADPGRYLYKDFYGPCCISLKKEDMRLAEKLFGEGDFDVLVLSGISPGDKTIEGKEITVFNVKDSRSLVYLENPGSEGTIVKNREYINRIGENEIFISDDDLSFVVKPDCVRISMSGDLAVGIGKMAEILWEEDGFE